MLSGHENLPAFLTCGAQILAFARYPKAMLSVNKTSIPFNFHLIVTRVYEEGDANILDEDDDDEGTPT